MLELPGYKIENQIGESGIAHVYLALHEGLQCKVVIKVMPKQLNEEPGFSERFMREASVVANLNQQNIDSVYDVNVYDGYHYIAMEFLPGVTLEHKIKQGISPQTALENIKQVAAALGYAHRKGIVHGDVKPENIVYREDGSAVLTNFDIVRSASPATKVTDTGAVIETTHYMSPEQAHGQKPGPSADIYSLGVVLYEALTGKAPYQADTTDFLSLKHFSVAVPKLEGELATYQPVLDCMMAKNKERRYRNCDEIIADIDSLVAGGTASNATTIISQKSRLRVIQHALKPAIGKQGLTQKKKFLFAAIAAGVIVIASAGGFIVYEQNQAAKLQQTMAERTKQEGQQLQDEKLLLEKKQAEEAAALKAEQDEAKRLAEQQKAAVEKARQLAAQKKAEEAKQLAAIELRKKEAARQAKLKAERDRRKKITELFSTAESQLLNDQLKAAYKSFKDILKLDKENSKARSGITRVADRYLALAITSAITNDFDKANDYIRSVIQIAPTHKRLASTQQEIVDRKNAYLDEQEKARRAGHESSPTGDKPDNPYIGF